MHNLIFFNPRFLLSLHQANLFRDLNSRLVCLFWFQKFKVTVIVIIIAMKNNLESRVATIEFISHKVRLKQSVSAFALTPVWNRNQARKTSLSDTRDVTNCEHPWSGVKDDDDKSICDVIDGAFLRFRLNRTSDERFIIFDLGWDDWINIDQLVKRDFFAYNFKAIVDLLYFTFLLEAIL